MSKITNVRKNDSGDITAVKLDNGSEMSLQSAVSVTKSGEIEGVIVGTDRAGSEYLHSKRGQIGYRLADLPEF